MALKLYTDQKNLLKAVGDATRRKEWKLSRELFEQYDKIICLQIAALGWEQMWRRPRIYLRRRNELVVRGSYMNVLGILRIGVGVWYRGCCNCKQNCSGNNDDAPI